VEEDVRDQMLWIRQQLESSPANGVLAHMNSYVNRPTEFGRFRRDTMSEL